MQYFIKLGFVIFVFFLSLKGYSQTEHYLGMIGGKVLGPIYTLQHNRWNVTATGGWLTGFKGGHVSINGGYRVLYHESGKMKADVGLGLFGQGYTASSAKQEQLAKELNYDIPFGVQVICKMHVDISENWSYGVYIGMPLTGKGISIDGKYSTWKLCLYVFQLSLQYKFSSTT
ncbi:MAG: hypothetical protein LBJ57_07985 [Prevotellaceae bacterium]|nr:hypothetical protein [Prevotellaceae bacterium]